MKSSRLPYLLLAALLVFATACDSGNDEAAPAEELGAMFASVQSALTLAFTASGKTAMPTVNCPQGGTLGVTNRGGSGSSFNRDLAYNNCNGINGTLNMAGSSALIGQTAFRYNVTLNGNLEEQCDVEMNGFQETVEVNLQNPQNYSIKLNGNISAQCSGTSVSCTFDDVDFDATSGGSAFLSNCE